MEQHQIHCPKLTESQYTNVASKCWKKALKTRKSKNGMMLMFYSLYEVVNPFWKQNDQEKGLTRP